MLGGLSTAQRVLSPQWCESKRMEDRGLKHSAVQAPQPVDKFCAHGQWAACRHCTERHSFEVVLGR